MEKKTIKPKVVKKAAASKAKKSASKTASSRQGIAKTSAAVRTKQEEGSIAPPTSQLVSAFDLFKKKKVSGASPAVTRLAAGSTLPKPALPKSPIAPAIVPAAPPLQPTIKREPAKPAAAVPDTPPAPAPLPSQPVLPPPPAVAAPPAPATTPAKPTTPTGPQKPVILRPSAIQTRPMPAPNRPNMPRPAQHSPRPQNPQQRPSTPKPQQQNRPAVSLDRTADANAKPALKKIKISSMVTVRELAEKMEVKTNDVIKKLMSLGIFATINQRLDTEAAQLVAADFGYELEVVAMYKEEELAVVKSDKEDPAKLRPRPPVITIMGHVDHGKTSLLDAIREARVAEGESGGITQHIGAYKVRVNKGEIVFLDTPGHEAFTAMRARGAKVTDIVVLVVSATDGIMPQTIEAIDHAKAANVPIVVAVNKIDLPGANPQKIRQDLSGHGLQPEEWGGKNIFVDVSAKKRLNLEQLLENLVLQAEILDLKSNPDRPAFGTILEAKMDPKRGAVATVLVQSGTLKQGDSFVAGLSHGKVKALVDDKGARLETAGPSTPVEILGIMGTPLAGDAFTVVEDEKAARDISEKRRLIHREQSMAHQKHMTLVGLRSALNIGQSSTKDLHILLKADMQGSLQALRDSLENLSTTECRVRIIHGAIGNANESDVLLASASDAVTLLFQSEIEPRAAELASREGVEVRKYDVIYDLIEDVKAALEGLLAPEIVDVIIGKGEVKQLFKTKSATVAGSAIRDGKVTRGAHVRVVRNTQTIHTGKVTTLRRFKDDVKEVEKGLECGIGIEGFTGIQVGDLLEFFAKESRTRRLSQSPR